MSRLTEQEITLQVGGYYNRFDRAKNYDRHLMREGRVMQATEVNEIQSKVYDRLGGISDALFKDGDVIDGGQIVANYQTGEVICEAGAIYISREVRTIPPATLHIPVTGTVNVGVRLSETIVTENEDPTLRCIARGTKGEGEPGAWRLRVNVTWGFEGDGAAGDFYPVYAVDNGVVRPKEAPPALSAVTEAIRRYDRDSTGTGTYICDGLTLMRGADRADGAQVYHLAEGRARVDGIALDVPTSRLVIYPATPDLRAVTTEVHAATADAATGQRVDVAHSPIWSVTSLSIRTRETATVTHGLYVGASDDLPYSSVVSIEKVWAGGTEYKAGVDYKKTGDAVDWSPGGAEPDSGSTYQVTYTRIKQITAKNLDADGFTVVGAVEGTDILVSYMQALPRYDRLALDSSGSIAWYKGVPAERNPIRPRVPESQLAVGTVYQAWRSDVRTVYNDGVRVTTFDDITTLNSSIDAIWQELSRQRLEADVATREGGVRVGIFVDPLRDDSLRDDGVEQTAAIVDGLLTLPIYKAASYPCPASAVIPMALDYDVQTLLEQPLRTGTVKVNPYQAFDPLPAKVELTPAIDRWTETQTTWLSDITRRFGARNASSSSTRTQTVSVDNRAIEHLRQIDVSFVVKGFGPGEILDSITFDGVSVTPQAI